MTVSVVTPTCDRSIGLRLAQRWMELQTRHPDEWIIADGGMEPSLIRLGPVLTGGIHEPKEPGPANLCHNLLKGLRAAHGDVIVIWEDDDWYGPQHIEDVVGRIEAGADLAGSSAQRYYNVAKRCWRVFKNKGASLCQTAFRRDLIPCMVDAVKHALESESYGIDGRFWDRAVKVDHRRADNHDEPDHVVGIKGLPGTPGLGVGHRPHRFEEDPDLAKLREWIGDDAQIYAPYYGL